jgi:putative phage-type endonuclease
MLSNQDFALLRAKSLGGSDIGAVLGLSRYRSAMNVWMEKTERSASSADSLPLRFGLFAESFVASEYTLATGLTLVNHESAFIHPDHSYIHGHVDRLICSNPTLFSEKGDLLADRILECKTANPFTAHEWGDVGTDQVPLPYLVQCAWYLAITGLERADLAVLFGNADFRIYEIHRDLELEGMILDRAKTFWEQHVLADVAPPAQRESDYKQLFPRSEAKAIEASKETCELIKKLKTINEQINSYEQEVSNIKQSIMGQMKEAEVLTHQGQVLATWKSPKPSTRLDTKKLSLERPELMEAYQVQIANSRRLVIKELS